ncbi:hypothetical protein TSUD_249320 [Trifolium subterraneum]|nr:hypothetical protein TSUD_249320 [Trifolium subterraneum]
MSDPKDKSVSSESGRANKQNLTSSMSNGDSQAIVLEGTIDWWPLYQLVASLMWTMSLSIPNKKLEGVFLLDGGQ